MPRLSKIGAAALAAFGWTSGTSGPANVTATYLAVAGGGAGGSAHGGGGGAGGFTTSTFSLSLANNYTVVVGAGGAAPVNPAPASNGANTTISGTGLTTVTAVGGGGGGSYYTGNGFNGGSGGGGGGANSPTSGGTGTAGQGNAGGAGALSGSYREGGGGGGAGGAGASYSGTTAGAGGIGLTSSISGTSTYYAGGGGGGSNNASAGAGGLGGGGAGGSGSPDGNATPGTANTGGGAGGVGGNGSSANGGSGVVIISYAGAQQFGGGTVTSVGGNTIHTFTTSGTLAPLNSLSASYLIVAGGGGGSTGGGGAGGMLTGSGVTIDTNSTYLVTVGSGGAGATTDGQGTSGTNSAFSMVTTTAIGGGGAGGYSATASLKNGLSGGSGGGGGVRSGAGAGTVGAGTSGQGNNGGLGYDNGVSGSPGGGGGGAGAVGGNASATSIAGNGGVGLSSSISGTSTFYAGGGGGSSPSSNGTGGNGGGGAGVASGTPNAGTANTGGGGGGNFNAPANAGGNGGSGIVIISYAGSTQQMAGGTVTIVGGNVIHTFTSSGYLTPLTYVGNSLRFRSSASAYLSRTPTVAGNRQKWTWSGWVKRGKLGALQMVFWAGSSSTDTGIYFNSDDTLYINGNNTTLRITSQVFRDPAAWYHIVVALDTTQSTAANRVLLYINGSQVTSFSTNNAPTLNDSYAIDNTTLHYIGEYVAGGSYYFDGYMTNVQFVDGQQLTPNSFGTFNSYGVWQPINYGGSYGTNGFYLPFKASTTYNGNFNGSSQYLSVNANSFNASSGNWTIEGWCYANSSGNNDVFILGTTSGTDKLYINFIGTTFYLGDNTNNTIVVSSIKPVNQWFHLAVVKNGSTYTAYINGSAIGSSTTALANSALTQWQIGYRSAVPGYWSGYLSNVRVVNGTAVYTSNFVPQTTPLTAITNTQLLTLQNATIIDNSTNAFTITNTGSVTTSTSFPFINQVATDNGPAGNSWATNNFGSQLTSNIDSMTDVPTLTSTTAANYCVLNPLYTNSSYSPAVASLSNGNLTITPQSTDTYAQSTFAIPTTGKYYWEVTYNSSSLLTDAGIATSTGGNGSNYISNGQVYVLGVLQGSTVSAWSNGDVIGCAIDMGGNTLAFYKNNTLITTITAYSGTAPIFSNAYIGGGGTGTLSHNYGQQPFKYTPPSGFVALNTYNL